VMISVH